MLACSLLSPFSLLVNPTPPLPEASSMSRRAVVSGAGALLATGVAGPPLPAFAFGGGADGADVRGLNAQLPKGEKDVNKFLSNKGFSTMKVPGGFSPLAAYIGTATPANIDGTKVKSRAFSTAVRAIMPKRNMGSRLHACAPMTLLLPC